jgi:hypothetical protein
MALSEFQRGICRLLAAHRHSEWGSYVAGGAALNEALSGTRLSRDVDVFHDTLEALDVTWQADRSLLKSHGYRLDVLRERPGFIEAIIHREGHSVEMQWVRDSAFRFFPLMPHPEFGLTLHPFDLATNKVLALVGRVEVRDWIDTLTCHEQVAPLGLLAWAACGKDEGWNPQMIVDEASRTTHYSREEIAELDWTGEAPDFIHLKTQWRQALLAARHSIALLPPEEAGHAVLDERGAPFRDERDLLQKAIMVGTLYFHKGHIGGAWPQIKGENT